MNEEFVNFALAKKLKEKGFDWGTLSYYQKEGILSTCSILAKNNVLEECCSAPTTSQVMTWLREEKKLSVEVFYGTAKTGNKFIDDAIKPCWRCCVVPTSENFYGVRTDLFKSTTTFASWEEATLAGIEFALDKLI